MWTFPFDKHALVARCHAQPFPRFREVRPATLCSTLYQPQALDSNKHDATLPAYNSFQLSPSKFGQVCLKLIISP